MSEMSNAATLLSQTGWIQSLARKLALDPETAEDVAQDTWVTALESDPETDRPLRGWLATVLRNHLGKQRLRESNRKHREHLVSRRERTASTYELVAKATTQKDLVGTVLELEEPYRETILLRFFEDLTYQDIALRMQVSPATVNSRITRGLTRLRERLDGRYGDRQTWLLAFLPLTQMPKAAIAAGAGALSMTTMIQFSVLALASTAAVATWQSRSVNAAVAPVSLGGGTLIPEGIELFPPSTTAERVALALPAALRNVKAFDAAPEDTWETDLSLDHPLGQDIEQLSVNSGAGDVTILRGEGSNVRIDAHVKADLERVDGGKLTSYFEDHVTVSEENGVLTLRDAHSDKEERGWGVSLTVYVPRTMHVKANSGAGDVTVRHASGDLSLNSGAGSVYVDVPKQEIGSLIANSGAGTVELNIGSVREALTANSGAGDVSASIGRTGSSIELSMNSGAGNVDLTVPRNVSGSFSLRTDVGSVDVPAELGLLVRKRGQTGAEAQGNVGSEAGKFRLQTGVGSIRVSVQGSSDH
ncbi:MAG: RNA polymerase sigma factor (sigma-70 family) [Chlamydiales bacterium]|jgi:RNA polymerase sigma factor (sigma-70 family)